MDKDKLELNIMTWGSCRYSEIEILYPSRMKLSRITNRRGKHVVDLGFLVIEYNNADSRKNLNRKVRFIETRNTVVVRYYGNESCSRSFEHIYIITPPNNVNELTDEIKEEMIVRENGKYRMKVIQRYINLNDNKIVIDEITIDRQPIMEKLSIVARIEGNKIVVCGDTYHVRNILKELKFRWDWKAKCWYTECIDNNDIGYTLMELEYRLKEQKVNLVIENQ